MNQMNMGGFPGNVGMPMPNNGPNGAVGRMQDDHVDEANYEAKLNSYIYVYLCSRGQYDTARTLKDSGAQFDPPITHGDGDMNGTEDNMPSDTKDGMEMKRPADLPDIKALMNDGQGGSFLLSWFALFWDVYFAQRKNGRATANAALYVHHTQQQARMRQESQQHQMLQRMPMGPNGVGMGEFGHMMRFPNGMQNENLQRRAQLNRGGLQPTPQQVAQMRHQQMMQQQNQHQIRRDPSEMDMNGQRPRSPSAGDHAPSPSKRQRMDGVAFNGQPMIPSGRGPPPGMPTQMMGEAAAAANANHLLMNSGINPGNLSESQFASFQQQNPAVQQKSIQVYAQNLAKNQRQQSMSNAGEDIPEQGSQILASGNMDLGGVGVNEFYAGNNPQAMGMRGGAPPQVPNGGASGNHALQDYQMQLMLLEQQNKKRLLMARQEQDSGRPDGMPGMPGPGFPPGMSPSGSRGGPSPGPGDQKRGTPKMNQVGLPGPGSPMPDGSIRGSPAAMNFTPMNPEMYNGMSGNAMRPPSSHPGSFPNGQYTQQQMEAMTRPQQSGGVRMPNGWQQGPQGPAPMIAQPQPQPPSQMGTPQQRNNMPPPQGVPNATANGRPASPPAPPTPQPGAKANPKGGKKDTRDRKKPVKKGSTASVAPTPTSEADNQPPTSTPATPATSQHANSFASKAEGQGQANMMQGITSTAPEPLAPQQPDPSAMQFLDVPADINEYNMNFNPQLDNPDVLENFDFEQFLQTADGDFFDPSTFPGDDGIEAGIGGGT